MWRQIRQKLWEQKFQKRRRQKPKSRKLYKPKPQKQAGRRGRDMRKESMLDIIIENSDRRLDAIQFRDIEYQKLDREVSGQLKRLEKMGLTRTQNRAVDELLSAYNAENSRCCRIFYRQGFKDCVLMLKEIGVIC